MKNKDRPEIQNIVMERFLCKISYFDLMLALKKYGYAEENLTILEWMNSEYIPFTDFEKELLSNIDINYKWIARDNNDHLFIYELKPHKNKSGVINKWYEPIEGEYQYLPFIDLFKSIKLEDEEPVCIDDIVKRGE